MVKVKLKMKVKCMSDERVRKSRLPIGKGDTVIKCTRNHVPLQFVSAPNSAKVRGAFDIMASKTSYLGKN